MTGLPPPSDPLLCRLVKEHLGFSGKRLADSFSNSLTLCNQAPYVLGSASTFLSATTLRA